MTLAKFLKRAFSISGGGKMENYKEDQTCQKLKSLLLSTKFSPPSMTSL